MAGANAIAPVISVREVIAADDESTVWPEGSTAVVIAEAPVVMPATGQAVLSDVSGGPLPALDLMVRRIPPSVREALDDLFRVKFTAVTRVTDRELRK